MIVTIVGKPGAGKSLYALRHLVRVLVETQNSVVTNLSVKLPDLQAYLDKRYPGKDIDVTKRIRCLDTDQARRFWLYRIDADGRDVNLSPVTRDQEKAGVNVDYEKITQPNRDAIASGKPRVFPGICYLIDECHVFFDSRAWAESGLSLTYYNSQHRKLDDDILFLTQFLELIDKRVKGFSQEFVVLRNNAAEKIFTVFRGPSYFTAKHYQKPPTGMQDFPSEVHRFGLDLDLANCYDTSAGVGISGVGKPETKKKKGLHIAWAIVPVLLGCYLLWAAPDWAAKGILGTGTGKRSAEGLGLVQASAVPSSPGQASIQSTSLPASTSSAPGQASPLSNVQPVFPTGYTIDPRRGRINIYMSDGTIRTERDSELTRIERNFIILDGQKLYFKPTPRSAPVAPVQVRPIDQPPPSPIPVSVSDTWDANTGALGVPSGQIVRPSGEIVRPSGEIGKRSR